MLARIIAVIGALAAGLLVLGGCQSDGAGTAGLLAYRSNQQICRTAIVTRSGQAAWESGDKFQPSVREAQSRGLKIEDCVALLAAANEGMGKVESAKAAGTPGPMPTTAPTASQPKGMGASLASNEMVVALQWEGVAPLASGLMRTGSLTDRGDITLSFGDPRVECVGQWMWARGKYKTAKLPEGTWSMACNNGLSAAGTYKSHKERNGNGSGTDQHGRPITFTFSSEVY